MIVLLLPQYRFNSISQFGFMDPFVMFRAIG